jgi:glyoxalase family protein
VELVAHAGSAARPGWGGGTVPAEAAIRGVHGVTLWVDGAAATTRVLTETLGFRPVATDGNVARFEAGAGGPGHYVDVRDVGGFLRGVGGAGTVHHVAFRSGTDEAQERLGLRVAEAGLQITPMIDRQYFHSMYFREPGGVLFELATDAPGFAVDEPVESLGEALKLPPRYERLRAQIERVLLPIHLPTSNAGARS